MTKTLFIQDISPGDIVEGLFAAVSKSLSHKKDGDPFMNLVLADKTGSVKGVAWDGVTEMKDAFSAGDYVHVVARAGQYREELQLTLKEISRVDAVNVNPGDFLPVSAVDPQLLFNKLRELTETIQDPHLARLMESFWADEDFVRAFINAPAAKKMHHAYVGGLVEHTLSVALLVDPLSRHYIKNKGVNRDLLLAGAVLHDIGKIDELECKASIDYSDKGRLLSHIITGVQRLDGKIAQLPDFPEETAMLLRHMIVSHHGEREFGSPEPPKTLEAVILNMIDDLDAKVTGIRSYMEKDESGEAWTDYHRLLGRHFYKGGSGFENG